MAIFYVLKNYDKWHIQIPYSAEVSMTKALCRSWSMMWIKAENQRNQIKGILIQLVYLKFWHD